MLNGRTEWKRKIGSEVDKRGTLLWTIPVTFVLHAYRGTLYSPWLKLEYQKLFEGWAGSFFPIYPRHARHSLLIYEIDPWRNRSLLFYDNLITRILGYMYIDAIHFIWRIDETRIVSWIFKKKKKISILSIRRIYLIDFWNSLRG